MLHSPNQVLTHAARAAAKQPPLVAARGAREGLWLEQMLHATGYARMVTRRQAFSKKFLTRMIARAENYCVVTARA